VSASAEPLGRFEKKAVLSITAFTNCPGVKLGDAAGACCEARPEPGALSGFVALSPSGRFRRSTVEHDATTATAAAGRSTRKFMGFLEK